MSHPPVTIVAMTLTIRRGPRERLRELGPRALSDEELLAALLGSGSAGYPAGAIARTLLASYGSLREMGRASIDELASCPGIGRANAARLVAAFELGLRRELERSAPPEAIATAADVYARLGPRLRDAKQESFWILLLNAKNRLQAEREVSRGVLDGSLVHPREIFGPALREAAAAIVLAHNHPSGDPTPSEEDVAVTRRLVEAGRLLGIRIVDHVILGDGCWASLAERGLLGKVES